MAQINPPLTYKQTVSVLGMGIIGLPTACILSKVGYKVFGVDINIKVINQIKSFHLKTPEPNLLELLSDSLKSGMMTLSTICPKSDIYIIAVPTLLSKANKPDLKYVDAAIASLIPNLKPGNLIIIESTCPINTTDKIGAKIRAICSDVYIAYCPERALPGNIINEMLYNNKIVGGIDEKSTILAYQFYKSFLKGKVIATDAKTAEAVKLAENTYRDINIAYANELSMLCDDIGINANKIINLANEHPRVNILQPGVGVGGHCIAIDPYFLGYASPKLAKIISVARKVNNFKTKWVITKILKVAKNNDAKIIACLGVTYKPNIPDCRNSPALKIVKKLQQNYEVIVVDPYINCSHDVNDAINSADIIAILVKHKEYLNLKQSNIRSKKKILLDFGSTN